MGGNGGGTRNLSPFKRIAGFFPKIHWGKGREDKTIQPAEGQTVTPEQVKTETVTPIAYDNGQRPAAETAVNAPFGFEAKPQQENPNLTPLTPESHQPPTEVPSREKIA